MDLSLREIWDYVAKQFPMAAVIFGMSWFYYREMTKKYDKHLADKDKEIDRLVKEKKELQKFFLPPLLRERQEKEDPK